MRALALEHLRADPVGIFGDVLEERGIEVDAVQLEQGQPLPDWRDYDLLVAMGGAMSVWEEDEHPWLVGEKRAIREAVLAGVPYFGVCLGAQLLAAAFGTRVYLGPEPELGASPMFLTAAAGRDPVFRGFPPDVEVFEFHVCHFDLPPGAVRLARSPRYHNQAIRYGRVAYAIQCHLEPPLEDIRAWFEGSPQLVARFEARHGVGSVEAFFDEYARFVPFLQRTGRQLFGRWLEHSLALGGLGAAARSVSAAPGRARAEVGGLVGRERELRRLDAVLAAARAGESAALVLRGEAGSGKTRLLEEAVSRAAGLRVLRTAGLETAVETPFAGLAELCRPLANRFEALAPARALALAAALALGAGTGSRDRFAAYAAVVDLFTGAAEEQPLLLVVDDAHCLDETSAEAVTFVAQRLGSDGIALLAASEAEDDLPGVEELQLEALDAAGANALVEARFGDELAPAVAARVVEAANGNPLALLEIPLGLTAAQRAGEEPLDEGVLASAEWAFLGRVGRLPGDARKALLVAALSADAEISVVERACATLGADASPLPAAEEEGLVRREDDTLVFRHSLVRSAVAYSALRAERRAAHAALADAVEGPARLWHLARAAAAPDAALAAALEEAAESARGRGAYGAAARTLELAARLTPEPEEAARRLLLGGGAAHLAGHVHAALDHLDEAAALSADPRLRSRVEHLRGRVAARSGSASRAREILEAAALACAPDDPVQAAEMLADAVLPCLRAGEPAQACALARRAAELAEGAGGRAELAATLMLGTALVFAGEYGEGAALVERAADLATENGTDDRQLRSYVGAGLAIAGQHRHAREVLEAVIDDARSDGALGVLPYALVRLATVELETGRWPQASVALHEALRLAQETGQSADTGLAVGTLAWLEAAQGHADACRGHVDEALELADRLGSGSRLSRAAAALGLLELGAGRPAAAMPHLEQVRALQVEQGWSDASVAPHVTADLVEAYAGAGRADDAATALDAFERDATRTGRASARAAAARCRVQLADHGDIDAAGAVALALATSDDVADPFERARTQLACGARLLATGRTDEARELLEAALDAFDRLGAAPWAERARQELLVAGVPVDERPKSRLDRLTPLELELALAVAGGASAREAGSRLFVGPRTAQLRLASAVAKLGLDSPAELAAGLAVDAAPALQPPHAGSRVGRQLHGPLSNLAGRAP